MRYTPLPEAAQESESDILARVYSFVIHVYENRKATASVGCADIKGGEKNQSKASSGSGGPSATDSREELR